MHKHRHDNISDLKQKGIIIYGHLKAWNKRWNVNHGQVY